MSRTIVNFCLDCLLLLLFLTLVWTSVVLRFVFPTAAAAAGWTLWGRSYDDWAQFQFGLLCVMALAVLLHVMLHWSWVCGVVSSRLARRKGAPARLDDGGRTLYGVGLLIVIINVVGAAIAAAALVIQAPSS